MSEKFSDLTGLDQRSRDIFQRLVETYINDGEPIGSRTLSRALPINLSPASVRNVMADLEDAGLIFSPHTSAGRMPTELGLRFFVDALMEFGPLSNLEEAEIESRVKALDRERRVEDVLSDATNLLSGLSQCAGVVVTPKLNMRLKHIEFVNLGANRALVILVGEDGSVENRAIDLPPGMPMSTLMQASNFLNARLQGKTLDQVQLLMRGEAETLKRELDVLTAKVIKAGLAVWSGDDEDERKKLIVRGQANLIEDSTNAEDLARVKRLFDDLESKNELTRLLGLAEEGEGVRIFIGSENKLFSLSGSSLIVSPYHDSEENIVGVLGIIGPTRLNYARIIPMVDYTAKIVGRLLS